MATVTPVRSEAEKLARTLGAHPEITPLPRHHPTGGGRPRPAGHFPPEGRSPWLGWRYDVSIHAPCQARRASGYFNVAATCFDPRPMGATQARIACGGVPRSSDPRTLIFTTFRSKHRKTLAVMEVKMPEWERTRLPTVERRHVKVRTARRGDRIRVRTTACFLFFLWEAQSCPVDHAVRHIPATCRAANLLLARM